MTDVLRTLLKERYQPATVDYCIGNRQAAYAKLMQGWTVAADFTNHGEVMIVLSKTKPRPGLITRAISALRGN